MTEREEQRTPHESQARDAVRSLPGVAADPAFKARLREGFSAGTLTGTPALAVVEAKPRRRGRVLWGTLAVAAAAAILLFVLAPRQETWKITGVSGNGIASVDGRSISLKDMARAAGLVREGARIEAPEGGEIQISRNGVTMLITSGTDMRVPVESRRGELTVYEGLVAMGEVRITTAPRFHGKHLEIETPETRVRVVGTTLAILRSPDSTCVCVLEGTVMIRARSGEMLPVAGGHRGTFLPGGGEPEMGDILPMEQTKLSMFRDQAPE